MIHRPLQLKDICLSFPHKTCFEAFSAFIYFGSRIGIIGDNGAGKSSLLNILLGIVSPTSGQIIIPEEIRFGYVPQMLEEEQALSGAERFQKAFTQAIAEDQNLLVLDEPTNHLDQKNRNSLKRLLNKYSGTLMIATHDFDLLTCVIDTIWHIDQGKIHVFSGKYQDYLQEMENRSGALNHELVQLKKEKKKIHHALMKEQKRASKSSAKGKKSIKQNKWPTIVSHAKVNRALKTTGQKKSLLSNHSKEIGEKLSNLYVPQDIIPSFTLTANQSKEKSVISIQKGALSYDEHNLILNNIDLNINGRDRIAFVGDNGSGKSSLIKAILSDPLIKRRGTWSVLNPEDIGYLDQHYHNLPKNKAVYEVIEDLMPKSTYHNIRLHLGDFLFRKNEEVDALTQNLSGGEKARLSLAQICAKTPRLLILDEMTNNIDLKTRNHMIQVLKKYPGALILVSHDAEFLEDVMIQDYINIKQFQK